MKLLTWMSMIFFGPVYAAGYWNIPSKLVSSPDTLYYQVDNSWNSATAIISKPDVGGQQLLSAANPSASTGLLEPGPKIVFWGKGTTCPDNSGGPATSPNGFAWQKALTATGASESNAFPDVRWTPSSSYIAGCQTMGQTGLSASFIANPTNALGWYLYTATGTDSDGSRSFWDGFPQTGQDGAGANAYISGTFVAFRQAYWATSASKPFRTYGRARISSIRYINAQKTGPVVGSGSTQVTQAKQQVIATFINQSCANITPPPGPCQIQYLFNTALFRSDSSNWLQADWYNKANLVFDPAQGGIPVIITSVPPVGTRMFDSQHQLPIFVSQGAATQSSWGPVKMVAQTVDVAIEWTEFVNALRIVVGARSNKAPGSVTASEMSSFWGPEWGNSEQWSTLEATIGQEVYNPRSATDRVEIAGYWNQLYVGPQDRPIRFSTCNPGVC